MRLFGKKSAKKRPQDYTLQEVDALVAHLEKLVHEAKWGSGDRAAAAMEYGMAFVEIEDIDMLHAIYTKQPYRFEEVKQTAAERYMDILNGITDLETLRAISRRPYQHVFEMAAIHRQRAVVAQLSDRDQLLRIQSGDWHWMVQETAELRLATAAQLVEIINGPNPNKAGAAMDFLVDADALRTLSESHREHSIRETARERLELMENLTAANA